MKHISFWASRHIWLTRFLILLLYVLLNAIAWILGDLLNASGIELTHAFLFMCIALTTAGLFIYPSHIKKFSSPKLYRLHKTADIVMASATFLFIVFSGNQWNNTVTGNQANGASLVSGLPENVKSFSEPGSNPSKKVSSSDIKKKKHSFREWRKNMKAALNEIRQAYRKGEKGERIALIVLSIIVAIILILLLALLSCSIACSGLEAIAIALYIVGTTGIIFGLVRIIQRINTKYNKLRKNKEPSTTVG